MDSRVREMFRRETKYFLEAKNYLSQNDFFSCFRIFEQLVELDIDIPNVEGLRERLPYALLKISSEKIDRNDIITFFPIVWGKFEVFVKKLLFIVNKEQYELLSSNQANGLAEYMSALGVSPFIDKDKQTKQTKALYDTYRLRNTEAHSCETWSTKDFYYNLCSTLAAYLIVVKETIPQIEKAKATAPDKYKLDLVCSMQYITNISFPEFLHYQFYRIADINAPFKAISASGIPFEIEFDEKGLLTKSADYKSEGGTCTIKHRTCYEYSKDIVKVRHNMSTTQNGDFASPEEETEYLEYHYDSCGHCIGIDKYRKRKNRFVKNTSWSIDYLSDGGVVITDSRYAPVQFYDKENIDNHFIENGIQYKIIRKSVRCFDSEGYLKKITDESGRTIERWSYNQGVPVRVEKANGIIIDIRTLGNDLLYYECAPMEAEDRLIQRVVFHSGRIQEIDYYRSSPDTPKQDPYEQHEQGVTRYHFSYY